MPTQLNPTTGAGKLIQLNKYDIIVEILPRGKIYDIEKVYTGTGSPMVDGDLFQGQAIGPTFYDEIYQEIDDHQYFEIKS